MMSSTHGLAVFDENRGLLASGVQLSGEALYHAFMVRRAAFLGSLAQRPKLFLTTAFAEFEGPARRNIASSCKRRASESQLIQGCEDHLRTCPGDVSEI
jgi:hypothetical protein